MAQQTAIEWLIQWGKENPVAFQSDYYAAIDKAKQMHKDEILAAYEQGAIDGRFEMFSDNTVHNAEAYYNKTFTE